MKTKKKSYLKLFNYWNNDIENNWFYRFIEYHNLNPTKIDTYLYSVMGVKDMMELKHISPKIFFTGECLSPVGYDCYFRFNEHGNHHIDKVDLSLGFDIIDAENYMRFPIWLLWFLGPTATKESIAEKIKYINDPQTRLKKERKKFATLIARHDRASHTRYDLLEVLNDLATKWNTKVECPSVFMKNTDDLNNKFNNDKCRYLQQFRFNICPENCNSPYYVTEKLLDSFISGTIPIYWGALNNPEPLIFNHNAIIFYQKKSGFGHWQNDMFLNEMRIQNKKLSKDLRYRKSLAFKQANKMLIEAITELWENEEKYKDFCYIPPFQDHASEIIYEYFRELRSKMEQMFKSYLPPPPPQKKVYMHNLIIGIKSRIKWFLICKIKFYRTLMYRDKN